jgi:hypothetical protein
MGKETRAGKRERMRGLVEEWRRSGESAAAFARRHGLTAFKFQYWRDRMGGVKARREKALSFAPVRLLEGPTVEAPMSLEIRLAGGDVIRFGREVSIESVTALVRVLRGC